MRRAAKKFNNAVRNCNMEEVGRREFPMSDPSKSVFMPGSDGSVTGNVGSVGSVGSVVRLVGSVGTVGMVGRVGSAGAVAGPPPAFIMFTP